MAVQMTRARELLDLIANELIDVIENGVTVVDKDGVSHTQPAPAQYLAVAAKLVKDFPPVELPTKVSPVGLLAENVKQLPFAQKAG